MAIKRPNISKPGIVKPNMGKKTPTSAKIVKEEPVKVEETVQEVVEEVVQEVVEDTAEENEIEVPSDMVIQEEITAEGNEEVKEEVVVKQAEDVVEEVVEIPEDTIESDSVKEEPKKKASSKKKSSAKKSTKKEEITEEVAPVSKKDYKAKPLVDAMKEMIGITGCTTPEWEATKAEITEQVQGMHIDPDSTPAEMRYLIAEIDGALSQLKILKINADQQFNPLLKHINYVSLQAGSNGSNSEERKANAIKGLIEYKSNPDDTEYTNLLDIQVFAENQIAFYDEMIKILMDKKNMLITFSGIVKTETQLGSY